MSPRALRPRPVLSVVALTGCGPASDDDRTISMIVTESAPFQEPTELVKEQLEEDGWTLETTYVTDIIRPNQTVSQGEYDANFFQNLSCLRQFNEDHGLELEPLFGVYEAPGGICSEDYDSLEELPDGAQIAIPVDTANNGRGVKLLAEAGLLEIDESVEVSELSQADITANPHDFSFIEGDQQSMAQHLSDVDAAFAFIRLAAEIGLDAEDALALEGEDVALPFTCVVAVDPELAGTDKAEALAEAYHSDEVQQWFDEYQGGVLDTAFDVDIDQVWEDINS